MDTEERLAEGVRGEKGEKGSSAAGDWTSDDAKRPLDAVGGDDGFDLTLLTR